ncbi:hypothetical protein MLD38_038807 [Melastoma candidum]|uniref:Uncharacterized protein n=1 Tax=Melastoma candidum TaxID=119954 RepID=A0ACB9L0R6_9MYRT|nr:hypothetical protein MLD38_038807 [Melastoma candidum]
MIGGKAGHESNIFHFGSTVVVDCPVTEGPDVESREIGRAQGIYVNSQRDGKALYLVFSVMFTAGEYEGSSLEIQGPDAFAMKQKEFGVVSGTGRFRFARGFGILETEFMDLVKLRGTLKLNITVKHY